MAQATFASGSDGFPQRVAVSRTRLILSIVFLAILGISIPARAAERAVLLHWNDFHGQVLPRQRSDGTREGGIRALAKVIAETREREGEANVLVLDAGDWFQGTPEGSFSKGAAIIDLWNIVGVSAAVVGNHDFDFGEANLKALCRRARFPVLGANVVDDAGKTRSYLKPTVLLEAGGIRFGVIGLLTERAPEIIDQRIGRGLIVADAVATCRPLVGSLRKAGADCIVVLSHLGEGPERELAAKVPGIDIIIGGHSHTVVKPHHADSGTLLVQAGCKSRYIGCIEVTLGDGKKILASGELHPVVGSDEPAGEDLEKVMAEQRSKIEREMGQVVGHARESLMPSPRGAGNVSSSLGNWICDVMTRHATGALAIHNRGGIRDALRQGPVTMRDLFQVSPFGNELVLCQMTGADLEEVFVRALNVSEVSIEVSKGIHVRWMTGVSEAHLLEVMIEGKPLERDRTYRIVTNSYLAYGGDGWWQFQQREKPISLGIGVFEATVAELRRVKKLRPPNENRIEEAR